MEGQATQDKVREITEQLERGIQDLFESENYRKYLSVMSRFHNYSFQNSMLIGLQMPEASYVAGYTTWKSMGRNVRKGAHGIRIIAPCPYKAYRDHDKLDPVTQQPILGRDGKPMKERVEVMVPSYKVTTVFDVSMTEGKDLPELAHDLQQDVADYDRIMETLREVSPVPIEFREISSGAHGYYHLEDKKIVIKEGMSQEQNVKTCIHEISHAILHDRESGLEKDALPDRATKEVEAESIAYTVCHHLGVDSSEYSFGYIGEWSRSHDLPELKKSMNVIRNTASELITKIERSLYQEREKELEKEPVKVAEQTKTTELSKTRVYGMCR